MVTSLGADKVIDYTQEDFTQNGRTYDIIFDTVGKSSFSRCKDSLTDKGIYLNPVLGLSSLLPLVTTSMIGSKKAIFMLAGMKPSSEKKEDLLLIRELLEAGKIKPVIDRCYPMGQIVEAHQYVEKGHKKGNVIIIVGQNDNN
jgi:NADPH:quinone reductase-like Zn-dependent oxidoreductase